jgi:hypothetical protein
LQNGNRSISIHRLARDKNSIQSAVLFVPSTPEIPDFHLPYFAVNCAKPIECSSISLANFAGGTSEPRDNFSTLSA